MGENMQRAKEKSVSVSQTKQHWLHKVSTVYGGMWHPWKGYINTKSTFNLIVYITMNEKKQHLECLLLVLENPACTDKADE